MEYLLSVKTRLFSCCTSENSNENTQEKTIEKLSSEFQVTHAEVMKELAEIHQSVHRLSAQLEKPLLLVQE